MENAIYGAPYTLDAWKEVYPEEATKRLWDYYNCPNNIIELVMDEVEHKAIDDTKVKFVVLDEEFLSWNGSKEEYYESKTSEECLELLKKNQMHYIYQVLYIPVRAEIAVPYTIPDEIKSKLYQALCQKYKDTDIFLPGFMLDSRSACLYEKLLISMAKEFYKKGEDYSVPLVSRFDKDYLKMAYIPFVIRKELKKAVFTIPEILEYAKVLFGTDNIIDYSNEKPFIFKNHWETNDFENESNQIVIMDLIANAVYMERVFHNSNPESLIFEKEAECCTYRSILCRKSTLD